MATHKPAVMISGTAQDLPGGDGLKDIASIENGLVINEAGGDFDFRVEGDTATNLLVVDASANLVGIGTTVQGSLLEVGPSSVRVNRDQGNVDFDVAGQGTGALLLTDASTYSVFLGAGEYAAFTPTGAVFNEGGFANLDFRVESDNNSSALVVDSSADTVIVPGGSFAPTRIDFSKTTHFSTTGNDVDLIVAGESLSHMLFKDGSSATENIALLAAAAPNWQTMDRGLFIGDASTAPTGNPASGVFLWAEGNELNIRNPAGTVVDLFTSGGDVVGPASSNDHSIARFDGTTGKLLQDSVVNISDAGAITSVVSIEGSAGSLAINDAGNDVDFRVEGDSLSHMLFVDASAATENIALIAGAAPNWQSMDGGLFIGNASTAPTGNPSSGVFMWADAGELKARDSAGNVTTLTNPPSGNSAPIVEVFTSSGTWTKPAGAVSVEVYLIGGGGGGGSGRAGAASTVRAGGGGGGGGGYSSDSFAAGTLGSTESVTIGSAGGGGNDVTFGTTANGNAGSAGSNTSFGSHLTANGGSGGAGGSTSGVSGGTGGTGTTENGENGASSVSSGSATTPSASTTQMNGGGGGAGGGITAANFVIFGCGGGASGGKGGLRGFEFQTGGLPASGSICAFPALDGGQGPCMMATTPAAFGGGGGGGGANCHFTGASIVAFGTGGFGGRYGGGGGGGAGKTVSSGGITDGRDGAQGLCIVITKFA